MSKPLPLHAKRKPSGTCSRHESTVSAVGRQEKVPLSSTVEKTLAK